MIEDKTIKLGYGTIVISGNEISKTLTFTSIAIPIALGETDVSDCVAIDSVSFDYGVDFYTLERELNLVTAENCYINFRGHILDFSNFSPKSVNTLKMILNALIYGDIRCLAC
jgi:hypothetical protein